jgi:hypothetical protein
MRLKLDTDSMRISTRKMMLRWGRGVPCTFSNMTSAQSLKKYRVIPTNVKATISRGQSPGEISPMVP